MFKLIVLCGVSFVKGRGLVFSLDSYRAIVLSSVSTGLYRIWIWQVFLVLDMRVVVYG